MSKSTDGFSIIEIILIMVFVGVAVTLFFIQSNEIASTNRDKASKTAINAIYYNIEELYFPTHKGYPEKLSKEVLPGLEPSLLNDHNGFTIGLQPSKYRYIPTSCNKGICLGYTLRADLEKEADFIKTNRNK